MQRTNNDDDRAKQVRNSSVKRGIADRCCHLVNHK